MIFSLRQVIDKVRKICSWCLLTFDTFNRQTFWNVMKKLGIPDEMLNIWKNEGCCSVRRGILDITNGTKQGWVVAPVSFALFFSLATYKGVLNCSFEHVVECPVISVSKTKHYRASASFVICLLQRLLHNDLLRSVSGTTRPVSAVRKAYSLTINIKKTEVIHRPSLLLSKFEVSNWGHGFKISLTLFYGKNLEHVKSFIYFRKKMNLSASLDDKIVQCLAKAAKIFGKTCHRLWNERGIRVDTKVQVYKSARSYYFLV